MYNGTIIRATTPTHYFRTTVDPDTLGVVLITYKQKGEIVLEKNKSDLTIASDDSGDITIYTMSFKLTQQEANLFTDNAPIFVQVRVVFADGTAAASKKFVLDGDDVLNDEVLA